MNNGQWNFVKIGKTLNEIQFTMAVIQMQNYWKYPEFTQTFFINRNLCKKKVINIFKHPICDANIWHHKTNVKIQPFIEK